MLHQQQKVAGNNSKTQVEQARQLLCRAIEEKLDRNLERIFRLLGLKYPADDMYNSYLGIKSNRSDLRANAIEFLDNILDFQLKTLIIPLVEQSSIEILLRRSDEHFGLRFTNLETIFPEILAGNDNWLKMCTLHYMTQVGYQDANQKSRALLNDPDPNVQEIARKYYETLQPTRHKC